MAVGEAREGRMGVAAAAVWGKRVVETGVVAGSCVVAGGGIGRASGINVDCVVLEGLVSLNFLSTSGCREVVLGIEEV